MQRSFMQPVQPTIQRSPIQSQSFQQPMQQPMYQPMQQPTFPQTPMQPKSFQPTSSLNDSPSKAPLFRKFKKFLD